MARDLVWHGTNAAAAAIAGLGWFWAISLLASREHWVLIYHVVPTGVPPWSVFFVLSYPKLLAFLCAAGALSFGCSRRLSDGGLRSAGPAFWLASVYAIPMLEVVRSSGVQIAITFWEPLWLVLATGAAVAGIVRRSRRLGAGADAFDRPIWLAVVWLAAMVAGWWWYAQGQQFFDNYMLGYHDFGHFARRVVNTWEGRGFLKETPSLPAFWDHFNPGLALLVPLWGLWPSAKLFLLLQAICLAASGPLVFAIARAWGANRAGAAAWAIACLAMPAVGQLNVNYSYGWHPVSLALPLIFVSLWAMLRRRLVTAAAMAVVACSFKETVLVTLACLAAALAFQAWWARRRDGDAAQAASADAMLAVQLPVWGWVVVWAALSLAFVLVFKLTAFSEFQTHRFAHLGASPAEIALSPVLRPGAFWGQVARPESAWFVLSLLVPFALPTMLRGWPILLAAILPVGVLLAWSHGAAASIAFQYVTTLIPILLVAALAGAARRVARDARATVSEAAPEPSPLLVAGLAALAASLTASTLLGSFPWSSPTLTAVVGRTYTTGHDAPLENPRAVGTDGGEALDRIVSRVGQPDAAVLATGRIAAHLLNVGRLESVEQAFVRWEALCGEAGEGRSGVEVFDWIVLDRLERFQQSAEKTQFFIQRAKEAGFEPLSFGQPTSILILRNSN